MPVNIDRFVAIFHLSGFDVDYSADTQLNCSSDKPEVDGRPREQQEVAVASNNSSTTIVNSNSSNNINIINIISLTGISDVTTNTTRRSASQSDDSHPPCRRDTSPGVRAEWPEQQFVDRAQLQNALIGVFALVAVIIIVSQLVALHRCRCRRHATTLVLHRRRRRATPPSVSTSSWRPAAATGVGRVGCAMDSEAASAGTTLTYYRAGLGPAFGRGLRPSFRCSCPAGDLRSAAAGRLPYMNCKLSSIDTNTSSSSSSVRSVAESQIHIPPDASLQNRADCDRRGSKVSRTSGRRGISPSVHRRRLCVYDTVPSLTPSTVSRESRHTSSSSNHNSRSLSSSNSASRVSRTSVISGGQNPPSSNSSSNHDSTNINMKRAGLFSVVQRDSRQISADLHEIQRLEASITATSVPQLMRCRHSIDNSRTDGFSSREHAAVTIRRCSSAVGRRSLTFNVDSTLLRRNPVKLMSLMSPVPPQHKLNTSTQQTTTTADSNSNGSQIATNTTMNGRGQQQQMTSSGSRSPDIQCRLQRQRLASQLSQRAAAAVDGNSPSDNDVTPADVRRVEAGRSMRGRTGNSLTSVSSLHSLDVSIDTQIIDTTRSTNSRFT